ncbi:uncharacterized protein PHA67_024147 isoform 6-T6 [Liasis olivaceus]
MRKPLFPSSAAKLNQTISSLFKTTPALFRAIATQNHHKPAPLQKPSRAKAGHGTSHPGGRERRRSHPSSPHPNLSSLIRGAGNKKSGRKRLDSQQSYHSFVEASISFQTMDREDSYDALDPEKPVQCPYDKSHQIRACRFPYHLVKCRKNHPEIVQQLVTCPFNARHQVPREEISQHISSCDDKRCIEQDIDIGDQSDSTFIWGTSCYTMNRC